jgi:hypothetical protein
MKITGVGRPGKAWVRSAVVLGVALIWGGAVRANPAQDPEEGTPVNLKVNRQIQATDYDTGSLTTHLLAANNQNGKKARELQKTRTPQTTSKNSWGRGGVSYYPGDLTYQGGEVVQSTESHAVYVNCGAKCFGYPTKFLRKLEKSELIHVTDQYVGTNANNRYTVGESGKIEYPVSGPLGPSDIITLVYASASVFGSGYGQVHHIFFAPGIDVCGDAALTVCYSPDNPATFFFCAFHGSIDFTDIGHVLFTVQPYQNVNGCAVGQPSPNGPEVDSQASLLSHELIETITDPDGTAWWNTVSLALYGSEIGDECQNSTFVYQTPWINGTLYEIQPEYSNAAHACTYRPPYEE